MNSLTTLCNLLFSIREFVVQHFHFWWVNIDFGINSCHLENSLRLKLRQLIVDFEPRTFDILSGTTFYRVPFDQRASNGCCEESIVRHGFHTLECPLSFCTVTHYRPVLSGTFRNFLPPTFSRDKLKPLPREQMSRKLTRFRCAVSYFTLYRLVARFKSKITK